MNNKEAIIKAVLDQRVLEAQISQNLRCKKGTKAKKVKINTKVAE
jgi:hypothetical protein